MELKHSKHKFFKVTFYVFMIKIIGTGLAFLSQVIISRSIGIEPYGNLSIFLSIANILLILPLVGMDTGLIKNVAAASDKDEKKWFLLTTIKISSTILPILIVFLLSTSNIFFVLFRLDSKLVIYLVLYVTIMSYSKILDGFLQGEKKTLIANIFSPLANNLINLVIFSIMLTKLKNIVATVTVLVIVEVLLVLCRLIYIFNEYKAINSISKSKAKSKGDTKSYLKYCMPLFFVASIVIVHATINKFIVSIMMGNFEVGILRIFENYSAILGLFAAPFVTMWPIMSEYYKKNKIHELEELFTQSTIVIASLTLPTFITLMVCSKEIFQIFGFNAGDVRGISWTLFIFFLGVTFDAIVGPSGALLNMTKYSNICFVNNLVFLVLSIVLSIILIPQFGLMGAAIASSASKIIINSLNVFQNKRLFGLFPYNKIHLMIVCAGMPVYCLGLTISNLINVGFFVKIIVIGLLMFSCYLIVIYLIYRKNLRKLFSAFVMKQRSNSITSV